MRRFDSVINLGLFRNQDITYISLCGGIGIHVWLRTICFNACRFESCQRDSKGEIVHIYTTGYVIRDSEGEPTKWSVGMDAHDWQQPFIIYNSLDAAQQRCNNLNDPKKTPYIYDKYRPFVVMEVCVLLSMIGDMSDVK